MRLLVITQRVDRRAPILGFFIEWIRAFTQTFENVTVIAQSVRKHDLPSSVTVYSLGKEQDVSRFMQVIRCWRLCWQQRDEYDAVLVHMTPIWIVLNAPLWLVARKPIYLWYESTGRRWPLFVSLFFVSKVFSATPLHLPIFARKNVVTNHGIDTDFWRGATHRDEYLVVSMGRITPIKRVELVIRCFATLPKSYRLFLIGGPYVGEDIGYYRTVDRLIADLKLYDRVTMHFLDREDAGEKLTKANLFLHAGAGTLDKSLLQAMSAGVLTVSCSPANTLLPDACRATPESFAKVTQALLASTEQHAALREELRNIVTSQHSLSTLAARLAGEMEEHQLLLPAHSSIIFLICMMLAGCSSHLK